MIELESAFAADPSLAKKTQNGVLELINRIPSVTMKGAFYRNFASNRKFSRIVEPLVKEKDSLELKTRIVSSIGTVLNS